MNSKGSGNTVTGQKFENRTLVQSKGSYDTEVSLSTPDGNAKNKYKHYGFVFTPRSRIPPLPAQFICHKEHKNGYQMTDFVHSEIKTMHIPYDLLGDTDFSRQRFYSQNSGFDGRKSVPLLSQICPNWSKLARLFRLEYRRRTGSLTGLQFTSANSLPCRLFISSTQNTVKVWFEAKKIS